MLLKVLAHHQEAADPALLEAIMDRLDAILPIGPVAMISVLTALVLSVPAIILVLYARHRWGNNA